MKLYVAFLLTIVGLSLADNAGVHDDGQPGCKTNVELQVVNYRNIWDPTSYWVCERLGQPAKAVRCPDGSAWLDSQKKCVEWHDWVWEEPSHPPSKP